MPADSPRARMLPDDCDAVSRQQQQLDPSRGLAVNRHPCCLGAYRRGGGAINFVRHFTLLKQP